MTGWCIIHQTLTLLSQLTAPFSISNPYSDCGTHRLPRVTTKEGVRGCISVTVVCVSDVVIADCTTEITAFVLQVPVFTIETLNRSYRYNVN